MREVLIDFDNKSPTDLNKSINIAAFLTENDDVEYKFMEGFEGIWKPIQDFSKNNICTWKPTKPGKYMIMVQGKSATCKNAYDYLGRSEYEIIEEVKLIQYLYQLLHKNQKIRCVHSLQWCNPLEEHQPAVLIEIQPAPSHD